jgi:hypothetical protein
MLPEYRELPEFMELALTVLLRFTVDGLIPEDLRPEPRSICEALDDERMVVALSIREELLERVTPVVRSAMVLAADEDLLVIRESRLGSTVDDRLPGTVLCTPLSRVLAA